MNNGDLNKKIRLVLIQNGLVARQISLKFREELIEKLI